MDDNEYPKLLLPPWFDEICEYEVTNKGWLGVAEIELKNGKLYQVFFIEPGRLQEDMEHRKDAGKPFFVETGLIILPEITLEKIREILPFLEEEGFFIGLKCKNEISL